MNRKRLFQIIVIVLVLVGAVYFLSVAIRAGRMAEEAGEGKALAAYLPAATTKQDLTFEVVDYRRVGDEAQFDVKFPLVDERDWQIRNEVFLEVEGEQYPLQTAELVEIVRPSVDGTGEAYRIDTLTFADVPEVLDQRAFTLMIKEINTTPNEGDYCDPKLVQSIQEPMTEAFPDIEIVCHSEPGFDGFEIAPDSVYADDADALALFGSVVSHALNGRIIGLWEFSFGG
jgi:hypothetical protein